jgi:internalin A
LQALSLDSNQLTELPPAIAQLQRLGHIDYSSNPLRFPPPEIVEQGWGAVREHLREELERVWASKLLVVGQGGVGKTSLIRALRGDPFIEGYETTHGVDLGELVLPHPRIASQQMTLNTWDFAGQEINHATHQFFLTNRSLFLVVWNARHGFEQGRLYYWLDTVKTRAPEARILLVATHADQRTADLPFAELQANYGDQILGHFTVSNKTPDDPGIAGLREAIRSAAANPDCLPLMGERWPKPWLAARKAVRARAEEVDYVSPRELDSLLASNGVSGFKAKVLTKWLHELGEILYFSEVVELKNTVILNAEWVTKLISRVLESEAVKENRAIFTREHMEKLWDDVDPWMHEHLLRLMHQFDLSYRVSDEGRPAGQAGGDRCLVVELLPLDEADYHAAWDAFAGRNEIAMKFDLQSSIPAGIPTWFFAREHRFTTRTHWRYGALFADSSNRHLALLQTFTLDNSLRLTVRGPLPHNFFDLLWYGLEFTFARFEGLEIKRKIPCPGHDGETCGHEFELSNLLSALEKKRSEVPCPVTWKDVSVSKLLFGIEFTLTSDVLAGQYKEISTKLESIEERLKEDREYWQRNFIRLFNSEQSKTDTECPNVFALRGWSGEGDLIGLFEPIHSPGLRDRFNERFGKRHIELQLYCQAPGHWHPMGYERGRNDPETGLYQIEISSDFLRTIGPYAIRLAGVMKHALPVLGVAMPWITDEERYKKQFKEDIQGMTRLAEKAPAAFEESSPSKQGRSFEESRGARRVTGDEMRMLKMLLKEKDTGERWGRLKKLMTKEGHWLWLCPEHYAEYND